MADKQIDELPDAGPLDGTESVHVVQAAQSRKATTGDIAGIQHDHAIDDVAGLQAALDALQTYILGLFFTTTPTVSETLMVHVAGTAFTIPADFTAALQSDVGTNPTASFALDVQQNGASIGTITVSDAGVVSATTTSGTSKPIAAGDVIKIVAPGSADATAANMAFTIIGVR